jgi:hypothetical protein
MERIGIEPMTSSWQSDLGRRDSRRLAATNGSNHAGLRVIHEDQAAWLVDGFSSV